MKFLDKLLQKWRISKATQAIKTYSFKRPRILDVGSSDGQLFKALDGFYSNAIGIDLDPGCIPIKDATMIKGSFPDTIPTGHDKFDVISFIAVLEHFPDDSLCKVGDACFDLLRRDGLVVITVPHPFVDRIIHALFFLKLIDGMDIGAHHEFEIKTITSLFCHKGKFVLLTHDHFQFGLNNLFVFKKN